MRAYLASEGIPREFKLEELSESQKSALDFTLRLAELEEKGLVKIILTLKNTSAHMFPLQIKVLKLRRRN